MFREVEISNRTRAIPGAQAPRGRWRWPFRAEATQAGWRSGVRAVAAQAG
jgi:hypothetical protein